MAYTSEIEKLERRWLENPKGRNFAPLADAYRKAGEIDRAIDLCKSGLELHPDYVSAHIVYGRCLIDLKDDPAATEVFQKVLQLDPENILALRILAEIAERTGHYDQGAEWLARLISADPMNGDAAEALARMRSKAAQAKTAPRESLPATEAPAETVAEIVPEKSEPSADLPIERASSPNVPVELPPRLSLVDMATVPMNQPDFGVERASGSGKVIDADRLVDAEPELPNAAGAEAAKDQRLSLGLEAEPELPGQGAVAPRNNMGLESFDGIDFSNAPPSQRMEGMMSEEAPAPSADHVEVEGLARTQYEGSGTFRLDQPLLESTATPHLEPDGPPVSLPLIMPDDVEPGTAEAPQLTPPPSPPPAPPRASRVSAPAPVPAPPLPPDDAEDLGAADTATLSQAEPVLTETMAELYLKQGHKDDALRVYQALLARRPGDARLEAKVRELDGSDDAPVLTSHPMRAPASGLSLGSFLKKILGSRPGAPAADPLPEQSALPGPRVTSGATPQSILADAFADEPPLGPTPGSPSRPAADSLSLDAVFGDDGSRASAPSVEAPHEAAASAPAPAAPSKGGFSFDDFFGSGGAPAPAADSPGPAAASQRPSGSAPRPSTRTSRPQAPLEDAGDLDQFQAWLKGLKS